MSEEIKTSTWTMCVLSSEEVQALKAKEAEEARQRQKHYIEKQRYENGWNAYVESPTRTLKKSKLYKAYLNGWNAAKAQEEQQGVILFLLAELRKRMKEEYEWWGDAFDGPIQIVEKIQAAYEQERQGKE